MSGRYLDSFVVLFVCILFAGCASIAVYKPSLPDDIGDKGLVVGQVAGIKDLWGWSYNKKVLINNRKAGDVVNGFIAIPLPPGEYSLDGLYDENFRDSSSYGGMTITRISTDVVRLKRTFTVRPKEVTNLGLIILYPDPSDWEKRRFLRLFADNTEDMKRFLKLYYPTLSARLDIDGVTLAPGDFASAEQLRVIRKDLAMSEIDGSVSPFVAGSVGTLAEAERNDAGKVTRVKLIEIPTLSNIQSVSPPYGKGRFAFLTTNHRLFLVQNGKVIEKRPPEGLREGKVFLFGRSDVVIIDDRFEIYMSTVKSDRWRMYIGSMTKERVDAHLIPARGGFYAYAEAPPRLVQRRSGTPEFIPIALPGEMKRLGTVTESSDGLYAEEAITVGTETGPRPFYFRPAGKTEWETRRMPSSNCDYIKYIDRKGDLLSTECGNQTGGSDGKTDQYASGDGGRTWE